MSNTTYTLLGALAVLVLLFLGEKLNKKMNLKREYRSRQFLMPLLALIYCIVISILQVRIYHRIESLVQLLESLLGSMDGVQEWIQTHLMPIVFYLANFLVLVVFALLKRIIITLLNKLFKPAEKENAFTEAMAQFHALFAKSFYEENTASRKWYLRHDSLQSVTFLKVLHVAAFLISCAGIVVTKKFYSDGILTSPWYPVFMLILIGELYFFSNGMLAEEAEAEKDAEIDEGQTTADYSLMRRILRRLFPDKLSAENTTIDDGRPDSGSFSELKQRLKNSNDASLQAYGAFLQKTVEHGLAVDTNYAHSGLRLLRGESILFSNPFYYDLIPYVSYPMNRTLLRQKKVLVILGRHGSEESAIQWVEKGLQTVTHIEKMWRVGLLTKEPTDYDVGILTRSEVNNMKLHEANSSFFADTEFVVLMEPSLLMPTAQIGLNSIVRYCRTRENKQIVYCSVDKNCDGLLDALSHVLMTSLREVQATNHHTGVSSYMCWDGDSEHMQHRLMPNLSRYLGFGTELSFAALKNGIAGTAWYGGTAFPVTDMRWISNQYYYDLLHYANLPAQQDEMSRVFHIDSEMWSAKILDNSYLTVEDENFNMFEVKRNFATRARKQGFVNVISPAYLLRDYMAENDGLFNADPKAIPYITADYSHTARNVVLRLCLRMSSKLVPERDVVRELLLVDEATDHPSDNLWNMIVREFGIRDYNVTDRDGYPILNCIFGNKEYTFTKDILIQSHRFAFDLGAMENHYRIEDGTFKAIVLNCLLNAEYIAEQEDGSRQHIGNELFGHVFQKYMPGQYFTFNGKYYEMLKVTSDGKVLVRRAADHIHGRTCYRQERHYTIANIVPSETMGATKVKGPVTVSRQCADFQVSTPAYWELRSYNDFETGRHVAVSGIPDRLYLNKSVIKISIDSELAKPQTMSTLALLINEVLRTMLAENACFAAAVTPYEAAIPVTYSLSADTGVVLEENSIFLIEDSQLDIGILDTIERNLDRIFEVICDYLVWNENAVTESRNRPPEAPEAEIPDEEGETESKSEGDEADEDGKKKGKKKNIFTRIKDFFRRKKKKSAEEPKNEPQDTEGEADKPDADSESEEKDNTPSVNASTRPSRLFDTETTLEFEQEKVFKPMEAIVRKPYHERYYLLYGGCAEAQELDTAGVKELLISLKYDLSSLRQARDGKDIAERLKSSIPAGIGGTHRCDFCGCELTGTEYEVLGDGRERCTNCGRTAVRSLHEFEAIYKSVMANLKKLYGVEIKVPVQIKMVNAKKLHKMLGKTFIPTGDYDGRTLGVAIQDRRGNYMILIENGSPKLQSTMTMVHEMTHIWQYTHWDEAAIKGRYSDTLEVYEGMAKWSEIQYAYLIMETSYAMREDLITRLRDDEYGRGYLKYIDKYPMRNSAATDAVTPFDVKFPL